MSANVIKKELPYAVSVRGLLSIHLIIPLLVGVALFDMFVLESALRPYFTTSALLFPLYLFLFELPHIIGSFISYADRDYLTFYKKRLLIGLPLLLTAIGVLSFMYFPAALLCYVIYTMYHVLKQQTGIAALIARSRDKIHTLWSYLAIITSICAYMLVFVPFFLPLPFLEQLRLISLLLLLIFAVVSVVHASRVSAGLPRMYVLATSAVVLTSYLFIELSYLFFAVFVFRFVHDISAFMFYSVHDANRNSVTAPNLFYKLLKPVGLHVLVYTPLIAVSVTIAAYFLLPWYRESFVLIAMIGFAHYYLEGFMWKKDSRHREELRFSA